MDLWSHTRFGSSFPSRSHSTPHTILKMSCNGTSLIYGLTQDLGPVILVAVITHHTPYLTSCYGTSWINVGVSAYHCVLVWGEHVFQGDQLTLRRRTFRVLVCFSITNTWMRQVSGSTFPSDLCRRVSEPQLSKIDLNVDVLCFVRYNADMPFYCASHKKDFPRNVSGSGMRLL